MLHILIIILIAIVVVVVVIITQFKKDKKIFQSFILDERDLVDRRNKINQTNKQINQTNKQIKQTNKQNKSTNKQTNILDTLSSSNHIILYIFSGLVLALVWFIHSKQQIWGGCIVKLIINTHHIIKKIPPKIKGIFFCPQSLFSASPRRRRSTNLKITTTPNPPPHCHIYLKLTPTSPHTPHPLYNTDIRTRFSYHVGN